MQRRRFLTAAGSTAAAVSAGPLARHVARAMCPTATPAANPRRQRATVLLVAPPNGWRPQSWRDVPAVAEGTPFFVVGTFGSQAIGVCRMAAKAHNRRMMKEGGSTWAIVACTDGRLSSEGGAA